MDVLCSTAQQWALACIRRLRRDAYARRHRQKTGFSRIVCIVFLAGSRSTSELFNTQVTLAKLFVRGASRAGASRVEGLV